MRSEIVDSHGNEPNYRLPSAQVIFMKREAKADVINRHTTSSLPKQEPSQYLKQLLTQLAITAARLARIRSMFF
jgi:hypothetical protein